jgi:hypothetical protein
MIAFYRVLGRRVKKPLALLFGVVWSVAYAAVPTLKEKALESGCVTWPVFVTGSGNMYKCSARDGASHYFNVPGPRGASVPIPAPSRSSFVLLCKTTYNGNPLSISVTVDPENRTVNEAMAEITDSAIVWFTEGQVQPVGYSPLYRHEINRVTGTYGTSVVRSAGGMISGPAPSYECEKATQRKF